MSHTSSTDDNTKCKPLFILGVTILSLFLIAAITTPLTTTTSTTIVFAAEDEEEKEEGEEKEEKEASGEEEGNGGDEKEEEKDSSEEEGGNGGKEEEKEASGEEESTVPEEARPQGPSIDALNEATTTGGPLSTAPEPIVNLTGDQILNPQPVANIPPPPPPSPPQQAVSTTIAQPAAAAVEIAEPIKEFNATCKCITNTVPPTPPPPTPPSPSTQPATTNEQIPITKTDIQDSRSVGEVVDPAYTNFYTVPNLLDNIINDVSFWSQAGKSSFYMKLDGALDSYQVCSIELDVHKPTNSPYLLDVGVSQNYTGSIDQTTERIPFEKCVKNMDEILMIFDNPPGSFVSISELKLFGSKLGATATAQQPPTLQQQPSIIPPLQPSSTTSTENATKIDIQDSTAEIDIKNSTVTFKFDPMTATFVQQGSKQ